jgi:hypothetical protein
MNAHSRRRRALGLGELLAVATVAVVAAALTAGASELPADCHLTFDPPDVMAGGEPMEVTAHPSEDIEIADAVVVDPASGLVVTLFEDRPLQLFVNPADAVGGDWAITLLSGEEELCRGHLLVTSPEPSRSR